MPMSTVLPRSSVALDIMNLVEMLVSSSAPDEEVVCGDKLIHGLMYCCVFHFICGGNRPDSMTALALGLTWA